MILFQLSPITSIPSATVTVPIGAILKGRGHRPSPRLIEARGISVPFNQIIHRTPLKGMEVRVCFVCLFPFFPAVRQMTWIWILYGIFWKTLLPKGVVIS